MRNITLTIIASLLISIAGNAQTQVTKQLTLSNGDGWYRVIDQASHRANGMIRIWGSAGNNKSTGITMFISIMAYGQGGSISIVDNLHYNSNHVAEIRAGSSNGKYVLDIRFENINNPTSVYIQADGPNLTVLDTPIFGGLDEPTGLISISGKVIGTSSTRWPIYLSQKVGVGTTDIPSGYNLAVDGKAIMEEVKVQVSEQWPDYVFDDNYELISLAEVKKFIKEYGHLPEMPSAENIESNGLELGQMDSKMLKKIEELTLHLIKQEEEMQLLKKRLEELEKGKD